MLKHFLVLLLRLITAEAPVKSTFIHLVKTPSHSSRSAKEEVSRYFVICLREILPEEYRKLLWEFRLLKSLLNQNCIILYEPIVPG